ncbi:serine/threonine-protein kinase [Streptomyces hyderabadensis]|uniref:Protein kinase domain-containing protein n=1 Tax=Streptomyces hyderabadensis TaxID=598549 RepID=A0ABP9HV91_9ACTN|nr:serine/threonine-protein kinase [Streptomyces hyderabadensis]
MEALQAGDPDRIGAYRLVGRLGAGGMGQVFLGRSAGGRPVAVKVVRPEYGADAGFRRSFAREVEAARRVGGFFTAQVVDADPDAERPWLVSAFVPGPSLHTVVSEHGGLPTGALRVLAAGLAEGLDAIHRCGLVHRDLKPGNVIVAADGPRVIDFGIARALEASSHTVSGVVAGTPAYMSPEQARGDRGIGPASDVFALGSVLAFAATGRAPFGDGHPAAMLYRIVQKEPDLTLVDHELRGLVAACLAKDPDARPTAAGILDSLSRDTVSDHWLPAAITRMISEFGAAHGVGTGGTDGGATRDEAAAADAMAAGTTEADAPPADGTKPYETGAAPDAPPPPPVPQRRRGLARLVPTRRRNVRDTPEHAGQAAPERSLAQGWNGLAWGAGVADFRARFPGAAQENGEWWVTGRGPETFCGVTMDTQYAFNARGRLCLIAFYPEPGDRERLPVSVLETLGAPDGTSTRWTRGKVVVDVKVAGVVATMTHTGFADR